ncbi:MAG: GtrA family protein [Clostridia bacterium]|nr:GtrA family protein [Clostridia bacterium]
MINKIISKVANRETISYLVFGVLTTVVSLGSYELIKLLLTGGGQVTALQMNISNIGSWVLAVAFAYVTNKFFVFRSRSVSLSTLFKEITAFVSARLLSLGFEVVWMNVTVSILHINDSVCKIVAQFVIVVLNYIFSKLFIFKKGEK